MKGSVEKALMIGIGNSARQDDGLGWAFLDEIKKLEVFPVEYCYKFQLNLEDAEYISRYQRVIFADASKKNTSHGFYLKKCLPRGSNSFSTHILSPETVLYLCNEFYGKSPYAWIIGIQGYEWELKEDITQRAKVNLAKAIESFQSLQLL